MTNVNTDENVGYFRCWFWYKSFGTNIQFIYIAMIARFFCVLGTRRRKSMYNRIFIYKKENLCSFFGVLPYFWKTHNFTPILISLVFWNLIFSNNPKGFISSPFGYQIYIISYHIYYVLLVLPSLPSLRVHFSRTWSQETYFFT